MVKKDLAELGPSDMAAVAELEALCFSGPWREEQLLAALATPHFTVYGLKDQGQILAYVSLSRVGDEVEILNIATRPGCRRQGLGRSLLAQALERAAGGQGCRAFLEVRVGNAPALGLYHSLGFARVGVRKAYYRDTGEDALIMSLDVPARRDPA